MRGQKVDFKVEALTLSDKWDARFLEHAKQVSLWSKDPSTQVGAVIVNTETRQIISSGYNGFPIGVKDLSSRYEERLLKYKLVVHAEANAIVFAQKDLKGATLYCYPFMPCTTCAGLIIQAGIKRVVSYITLDERTERWWEEHFQYTVLMFEEAGVQLDLYKYENES